MSYKKNYHIQNFDSIIFLEQLHGKHTRNSIKEKQIVLTQKINKIILKLILK